MNLTIADLTELPLAAAALDRNAQVIARTPEWSGVGPGSVSYPVRGNRLVVAAEPPDSDRQALLERLLDSLDTAASDATGVHARHLAMLAASLRMVAGAPVLDPGTAHDVIAYALAGIAIRTGLDVRVDAGTPRPVAGPAIAALVVVQLAVNAERHERVTSVEITHREGIFSVSWTHGVSSRAVGTTRQHGRRHGWGLGFARLAADTLGGVVYPPVARGDGHLEATFELGLRRLALPLAMVHDGRVVRATRSWDEETGHHPPHPVSAGPRLSAAVTAAFATPGSITLTEGIRARAVRDRVWMAIPPDDLLDRTRDVLDGINHERALWEGTPEPGRSRVFALASLLSSRLGITLPRVPAHAWNRRCGELCAAFGVRASVPELAGIGALDPRIVAYLAGEFGEGFEVAGDQIGLRVRSTRLQDPVIACLQPENGVVRLT